MASPSFIDAVMDGGLDYLEANCIRVDGCVTEPTTYTEATSTYSKGSYVLDGTDWTVADSAGGRKVSLAAQTGNNATATAAVNFLAFTAAGSVFLGVIDADGTTVNSGQAWGINAVDVWTVADPT